MTAGAFNAVAERGATGQVALGVITEDLQAAVTVAGRLQQRGLRVQVVDDPSQERWPDPHAIVVDLQARGTVGENALAAERWASWLRERGCVRIEQRVDSAFRGAPAEVLAGVLRGAGSADPIVPIVMAYPGAGRICIDGVQRVHHHGSAVEELSIAESLGLEDEAAVVSIDALTRGVQDAVLEARRAMEVGRRFLIFDAVNEGHLEVAAAVVHRLEDHHDIVAVSSGGWLRYHPALDADGFLVVAAPGTAQLDRQQLARVADVYGPAARVTTPTAVLRETDELLLDIISNHRVIVVQATEREGDDPLLVADDIAAAVRRLLDVSTRGRHPALGVIVSGGVSAGKTIRALDAVELRPGNELEPLCPVLRLAGGPFANLAVITKASGIGAPDTLVRLVRRITGS
jgi:uncharacterized protein YgbK (DUF1537 family)